MSRKKPADTKHATQARPSKAANGADRSTPPAATAGATTKPQLTDDGTAHRQTTVAGELEQARAELERAREQAAENLDKFLRAKAEADNTRRRAEIEVTNAHKYGIEQFAAEMLTVRESLELARTVDIQQENKVALEKMHEGLDLTLKLMDSVFRKFALTVIDPKDEKFDPEKHQAVSMVDSDRVAPGYVVQVIQKGYMLHDRLLRPAMVVVAKAPSEKNEGAGT